MKFISKNIIELIGMKIAIFDEELSSGDNFKFMPLFVRDNCYVINGT